MQRKRIYLTFDDGPSSVYTPRLLDLLNKYEIKATFFLVGSFARKNPDIVSRMVREGHEVGVHSNTHKSAFLMDRRRFCNDMDSSLINLKKVGVTPSLYRPPYGHSRRYSALEAGRRGMRMVKWDVMAQDWRGHTTSDIIAGKILRRVFDGAVICLHDARGRNMAPSRTIEALDKVIPELIERGYTFETV